MKKFTLLIVFALGLFSGCANQTLAPAGVYQGDKALYVIDQTEDSTFKTLDTFVKWEKVNSTIVSKDTHAAAEKIRQRAPELFASLARVKKAYVAEPTPENRAKLQPIIADIQALLVEATKYFIQPTTS